MELAAFQKAKKINKNKKNQQQYDNNNKKIIKRVTRLLEMHTNNFNKLKIKAATYEQL